MPSAGGWTTSIVVGSPLGSEQLSEIVCVAPGSPLLELVWQTGGTSRAKRTIALSVEETA